MNSEQTSENISTYMIFLYHIFHFQILLFIIRTVVHGRSCLLVKIFVFFGHLKSEKVKNFLAVESKNRLACYPILTRVFQFQDFCVLKLVCKHYE